MKKCCFIVPYFGKFPNYFQLFLNSCKSNQSFNWLLFTDDRTAYEYPNNVQRILVTYAELCSMIQAKFEFPVSLERPYKLCDFRPSFGYVFEDYLRGYQFWGHCDVDMICGNLDSMLPYDFMDGYDKLFCLGHLTIYKNTFDNNRVFMSEYKGRVIYKDVFSSPLSCNFDEEFKDGNNINQMFLHNGKKVFQYDLSLNFSTSSIRLKRIQYVGNEQSKDGYGYVVEHYMPSLCVWEKGNIIRYYRDSMKNLIAEIFLYVHLQKRQMAVDDRVSGLKAFKIIPNYFMPIEVNEVTVGNFDRIRKNILTFHILSLYRKNTWKAFRKYARDMKNKIKTWYVK